MTLAVLLALGLQQPPLEADKERIRSKPPLTAEEKAAYAFPEARPGAPRTAYSLCVIPVEFTDRPFGGADLGKLFFGRVADYYSKASGGAFTLRGRVFDPVPAGTKRKAFRGEDLVLAMAGFLAREGKAVLAPYDGVAFVAAGKLGKRGSPLWPYTGQIPAGERTVDFLLTTERGEGREAGIVAHEIMHLLGFSDKYDDAKAEVGPWCILGTGYATVPPAPPCADCRERLGWTAPATVDPGKPVRIVMEPGVSRSLKVLVNPDASEYLLIEMRDRLFIWHVGGGRKIELVGRYPTGSSDRLTPLSKPSFRGRTVGARPAWVTDIRLEDGKAWFRVGPKFPLTPLEAWRRSRIGRRLGD